jgi:L-Ala-D/L-Glu epimerase
VTDIAIVPIRAEHAQPLRQALLHPDRPPAFSIYPGDGAATTLHVGAFADGALQGIASVYHEAPPASAQAGAWPGFGPRRFMWRSVGGGRNAGA